MEEPSVLDFLKAKLTPWRGPAPEIPLIAPEEEGVDQSVQEAVGKPPIPEASLSKSIPDTNKSAPYLTSSVLTWPWQILVALFFALIAQRTLEPGPERFWILGVGLYGVSIIFFVWAFWGSEWLRQSFHMNDAKSPVQIRKAYLVNNLPFLLSLPVALFAFLTFAGNQFNALNITLWLVSLVLVVMAFWVRAPSNDGWITRLRSGLKHRSWKINLTSWHLIALAAIALVVYFRLVGFAHTPPEMVSDHAEKLLDVWDVLHGKLSIFFPRNTGREGLQMYLTAAIIQLFGTGYSFVSLKIGTVLAGLLTLPFIYLLGKEIGNRRVGLLAMVFAGIAYWPNVISRVGLRFPLYPLFVAPALYFLLRGLRTSNRNDFILSGIALGIGLHGYTPIRILPLVILVAIGLYLFHRQSEGFQKSALWGLFVLSFVAMFVFLPLMRYALEDPALFSYRSLSRLGSVERPLPGSAGQLFVSNLWTALIMFWWDDGEIWVHSVPHRPALDIVSGALLLLGVALLLMRYIRQRNWLDLFLLISIPLLMLPSILSLAFPTENPSLNRMGGAIVPVFLIIGIAFDAILQEFETKLGQQFGKVLSWSVVVVLLLLSIFQNYDLVFNQYQQIYENASWNTSEMGKVIRDFTNLVGDPDSAYVVAFPYWVDTRLVGINAGYPLKDYATWPESFLDTQNNPGAKLFLIKPEDLTSVQALQKIYAGGVLETYASQVSGHDFFMFFVPPQE